MHWKLVKVDLQVLIKEKISSIIPLNSFHCGLPLSSAWQLLINGNIKKNSWSHSNPTPNSKVSNQHCDFRTQKKGVHISQLCTWRWRCPWAWKHWTDISCPWPFYLAPKVINCGHIIYGDVNNPSGPFSQARHLLLALLSILCPKLVIFHIDDISMGVCSNKMEAIHFVEFANELDTDKWKKNLYLSSSLTAVWKTKCETPCSTSIRMTLEVA